MIARAGVAARNAAKRREVNFVFITGKRRNAHCAKRELSHKRRIIISVYKLEL